MREQDARLDNESALRRTGRDNSKRPILKLRKWTPEESGAEKGSREEASERGALWREVERRTGRKP